MLKNIFISYIFVINKIEIIWSTYILTKNVQFLFLYKKRHNH